MKREDILSGNSRQYINVKDVELLLLIEQLLPYYSTFNKLLNDALRYGLPLLLDEKTGNKKVLVEEPMETLWSFQNRTMRGFEVKRESFKFGERSVEMVFGDIFDEEGKHVRLPLQNDAEIDNVTNRLNKKFKRNAQNPL